MANILSMATRPDFIQIQTWNDGPESHNIGNLWPEQNTDVQPSYYMQQHDGWKSLIASFITAWKARGSAASMQIPSISSGLPATGAMWYRALPMNAFCPYDDGIVNGTTAHGFWEKPFGFNSGTDDVSWAIVASAAAVGAKLVGKSNHLNTLSVKLLFVGSIYFWQGMIFQKQMILKSSFSHCHNSRNILI